MHHPKTLAMAATLRHRPPKSLVSFTRAISTHTHPDPNPQPHSKPANPLTLAFSNLLSQIRSEPDPDRIFSLLQSSSHLPRFYHQIPLHHQTLARLTRLRRPDLVERILESQRSDPKAPKTEGFFIRLLSLYSSSGLLSHARKVFDEMPQRTERAFAALLSACLDNNRHDLVADTFNSLPKQLGVVPDLWCYNIYLNSLCREGKIELALQLLDEMPTPPNIISYNTILGGCVKQGDASNFQKISKIVEEKKLEIIVVTYNYRMTMYCRNSESFKAEELLDAMAEKNVDPNLKSFNTVISGYCKEGDVESAVRVFNRLKGVRGMEPSSETYVVLIRGLVHKGEFGLGLEVCKECFARKFAPQFDTVKALVDELVKSEKGEEVKEVVAAMKSVVRGDAKEAWKKIEDELAL